MRLFDDALEVCEEVCQNISFPVTETLQNYMSAKKSDVMSGDKDSTTSVFRTCHSFSEPEKLDKFADSNDDEDCDDDDDDDDVSWYFDGHIPVVDSHMPRNINHTLGVYGHIGEISSHIPGIINIEAVSESHSQLTLLQNVQPEMLNCDKEEDLFHGVSRSRSLYSNQEKFEDVSFRAEDETLEYILRDSRGHVTELPSSSSVEFRSDASLFGKDVYEEEDEFGASFLEAVSNSAKENFQSSPFKNPRGTLLENCGSKTTDASVTAKACSKLAAVSGHEGNSDLKSSKKTTSTHSEGETSIENKDIANSESPGYNERTRADKLLSLVSRKLENKNKEARRPLNLSEIYKGSRHFVNNSTDTITSTATPSGETTYTKRSHTTDILFVQEDCRRTQIGEPDLVHLSPLRKTLSAEKVETRFTSKTSQQAKPNTTHSGKPVVRDSISLKKTSSLDEKRGTSSPSKTSSQSTLKAGQAEKSDLACATPLTETSPFENTNSFSTVLQSKDETVFTERNTQLLSKLGERLSHGKEHEMKLAVEVIKSLFRSSGKTLLEEFEIHLNTIHTELILGPPSSFSQLIDGLLLESTASFQTAAVSRITTKTQLIVALVNGDVTPEFRHAGLNDELKIHRVIENAEDFMEPVFNQEKDWHERVITALTTHSIGILIAKGTVKDSIKDHCLSHNIVVLQNVAYPKLQLLSSATGSALVTYLTDLREKDIGGPVTIETWELGWAPSVVRQYKKTAGVDSMETCQYVLVRDVKGGNANCEGEEDEIFSHPSVYEI